ncbi:MarR family winged helix-turn-helix transcriptional regulator [Lactiplantibacillus pentosus]
MQQPINYIMNIMHLERDLKRLTSNWSSMTGLSLNELRILVYVEQRPGIQIGDVATALNVAKVSLAQNIGTLITQGWLKSQPIKQDRRLRVLTLTKTGQERMKAVDEQLTQSLDSAPATQLASQLSTLQP